MAAIAGDSCLHHPLCTCAVVPQATSCCVALSHRAAPLQWIAPLFLQLTSQKFDAFAGGAGLSALKKVISSSSRARSLFVFKQSRDFEIIHDPLVTPPLHTRTLQTEAAPKAAGGERSFLDDIKKVRYLII